MTAVLLLAAATGLITALISLWPVGINPVVGNFFGLPVRLDQEHATFLVITLSGALGGIIHTLRSLYWYVGNRSFRRSWLLLYPCVPVVGSALAVIFYIVVRGGLLSTQVASTDLNPCGFAAIAALVGLFSSEAISKLKQVFSTIFSPAEEGKDHVPPAEQN